MKSKVQDFKATVQTNSNFKNFLITEDSTIYCLIT